MKKGILTSESGKIDLSHSILNIEGVSLEDTEVKMDLDSHLTISSCQSLSISKMTVDVSQIQDSSVSYQLLNSSSSCEGILNLDIEYEV